MEHYIEVVTANSVAAFDPPQMSRGDSLVSSVEKHVQILMRPPVLLWR